MCPACDCPPLDSPAPASVTQLITQTNDGIYAALQSSDSSVDAMLNFDDGSYCVATDISQGVGAFLRGAIDVINGDALNARPIAHSLGLANFIAKGLRWL